MAMTTKSIYENMARIERVEEKLKYYESKMKFYKNELKHYEYMDAVEYSFVERRAFEYERKFAATCAELREMKIELRGKYNLDAYGYDSPGLVDDSYYEKKFKTDGYFVAIKF